MKEPKLNSEIQFSGSSMFPLLLRNDLLEVEYFEKPQSVSTRNRGEILLIRELGEWALHRAVMRQGALGTKGDWSLSEDQSPEAWGRLARINGISCESFHSESFSKISERIRADQPKILRWYFRILLILYACMARWRGFRRSHGQY